MGKKFKVTNDYGDEIDVELDDDITEDQLDYHPNPDNALTPEEIAEIKANETVLGE